jgi:hypothetical protein
MEGKGRLACVYNIVPIAVNECLIFARDADSSIKKWEKVFE